MEETKMYKVTNKMDDVRKFRDRLTGRDILVKPKGYVLTSKPPAKNSVWKIEPVEQLEKKKTTKLKEDNKDGSNSNR